MAARASATEEIIDDFDVRTPSVDVAAFTLSGGNQQKLIVGREMHGRAQGAHRRRIPTRGIDVGAQALIWESSARPARPGLAVLLVSADLEELIGLSDRCW